MSTIKALTRYVLVVPRKNWPPLPQKRAGVGGSDGSGKYPIFVRYYWPITDRNPMDTREIIDYNGTGRWSAKAIQERYATYTSTLNTAPQSD